MSEFRPRVPGRGGLEKKLCALFSLVTPMAKSNNLPAKRYKAGERTERKLRFNIDFDGASVDNDHYVYIDIAQSLSAVNARFYRQGLYYYVNNVTIHNSGDAWVRISTIPDTYTAKLAWARGFKLWSKMNREATQGTNGLYPKYHDFKVNMDTDHFSRVGSASDDGNLVFTPRNILPHSYPKHGATSGVALTVDEWALSIYTSHDEGDISANDIQNADSFLAHMVGDHQSSSNETTSVGLIRSYARSRPPQEPGVPNTWSSDATTSDPLVQLFDDGDTHQEIIDDLIMNNDRHPYNFDAVYGSVDNQLNLACQLTTTDEGHIARAPGFCVPFGLIRVDCEIDDELEIILEIAEGPYNGVYAERVM